MKILYIIDSLARSGGAEQSLAAMAPHLRALGVQLEVAYLIERDGLAGQLRDAGAQVTPVLVSGRPQRVVALRRLIAERRPELVHTTLFEADVAGRIAAALARTKVVSSLVNASYTYEHVHDPALSVARVRGAQALDAATAQLVRRFHAISPYVAVAMARRLGISRRRIDVVPRGRDPKQLGERSPERSADARRRFGVPADAPMVVAAARHEHQKGLDVLVRAFPRVLATSPSARLLIAGRDGNLTPTLRQLVEDSGASASITLLGARDDVADLIAASDVFVSPSRWEGFGSVLLEAMALGAPIIASRVPAIEQTVDTTATLVAPGDPQQLASAITALLQDQHGAQDQAVRARRRFDENFTISRISEGMMEFYERAVAG